MKQVVEKFCNLSLAQTWCEDMQNIISYVSSKYEANATKVISYVILGTFTLFISVLLRRIGSKPKPKPKPRPNKLQATRSFIVRELHSGYPALDRLMTEEYEHPTALDSANALIRELQQELPDLLILQQKVRELETWEMEDYAEKILRPALKEADEKEKPHEAYEFEILLVEVLIYKAMIYKMLGNMEKAKELWDEFIVVRDPAFGHQIEMDFDTFKFHVHRLQEATENVRKKRNSINFSTFSI
ncbi:hypothetical protein V8G54_034547 [Vigna mungo]|uniref:Uncharacterized protein n=1 Tax=Vigna mungo TaxID=3915 RepID=A0AAQ3MRU2_VIGMU